MMNIGNLLDMIRTHILEMMIMISMMMLRKLLMINIIMRCIRRAAQLITGLFLLYGRTFWLMLSVDEIFGSCCFRAYFRLSHIMNHPITLHVKIIRSSSSLVIFIKVTRLLWKILYTCWDVLHRRTVSTPSQHRVLLDVLDYLALSHKCLGGILRMPMKLFRSMAMVGD